MLYILQHYLITFGWALTGAISMAVSLGVLVKIFSKITPINEWEEIKKHPILGAEIIKPLTFLSEVALLIRQDHERWDGKGYPDGLREGQIDIGARVIMLADSYDAMTSGRLYRKKLTKTEALEEIKKNTGTQFDPNIVEIFLKIMQEDRIG